MNRPSFVRPYGAELTRIRHRRATKVTVGLLAALVTFAGVRTFLASSAAAPDLAAAQLQADAQMADCRTHVAGDGQLSAAELDEICFIDPAWLVVDPAFHLQSLLTGNGHEEWADVRQTALERVAWEDVGLMRENPAAGFTGDLVTISVIVAFVGAALGATYLGADWRSGVIESHLIWLPDRRRLIVAKLAAVATAAAVLSIAMSVALVLAMLPAATWRGDMDGTGPSFWLDVGATAGRAALGTMVFAVLAGAIATLARNTAAGVAGILGWSLLLAILGERLGVWAAYLSPVGNLNAFVAQGDVTFIEKVRWPDGGIESVVAISHGWIGAGLVATAIAALLTVVSTGTFVRRDVS